MTAVAAPEPAAVVTPPAAASTPAAEATASAAASAAAVAPAAAAVPESYDLALREGSLLAKDALVRITERAKALGVADPAIAKAFVEVADTEAAEAFKAYQDAAKPGGTAHAALVAQYGKAALDHPEVGKGDPLTLAKREHEAGLELAERFPQLLPILKETGYAARWEVIAAFSKAWRDRQETPLATGTPSATRSNEPMEKQMYPGGVKLSSDAQRTP
jgi:hypothetical protein